MMNSHCQPFSETVSMVKSSPDSGEPIIAEKGIASMNNAMTRPR